MSPRGSLRQKSSPARLRLARCPGCYLHLQLCLCSLLEPITLATRVVVLRHPKEADKPTNTGRLVSTTLVNADVRTFWGRDVDLAAAVPADLTRRTLLLYPSEDSTPLARAEDDPRSITLVVLDADWRRARKLASSGALAALPRVRVPCEPPSTYRLRRHRDPRFLATFEAVARALGVLEGAAVQERLDGIFRIMVERMLWSRGQLATESVTGGVPAREACDGA